MANPRAGRQGISSMAAGNGVDESALVRETLGLKDPNRPVTLPLSKIRRDGGTQPRAALNQETVEEYAEAMEAGKKLPPATVFYDGTDYWLVDGFHRVAAVEANDGTEYSFVVRQGTHRAAILFSFGVNDEHGLRRTNEDKRRSVTAMLQDEEWRRWSDYKIAEACKVSSAFVGKMRASLSTVYSDDAENRTFITKHGTPATMRTSSIGGSSSGRPPTPGQRPVTPAPIPAAPAATPEVMQGLILLALAEGDLAWHELLRAIKPHADGEIAPTAFSATLRALMDRGEIVPSQRDQAAFALPKKKPQAPARERAGVSFETPAAEVEPGAFDSEDPEVQALRRGLQIIDGVVDVYLQSAIERMNVDLARALLDEVQIAYEALARIGRWLEIEVKE